MASLSKTELIELDRTIDSAVAAQPLLSQPRDQALMHLLRYFEDYVRLYSLKSLEESGREAYHTILKNGQDGMHFAVHWIFHHCPFPTHSSEYKTRDNLYRQARDLHEAAMNYSMVWDLMAMLRRGRATAERETSGTIRIRYANKLAPDVEVADRLISAPDSPEAKRERSLLDSASAPSVFLKDVAIRSIRAGKVKYDVPTSIFDQIADCQRQMQSHLWELNENWNLDGYTISQFRNFWVTLVTLCWVHHWVYFSSGIAGGALDDVIMIAQRDRWINCLAEHSRLDADIVAYILEDLIYDANLYKAGQGQPDVTYQPFFRLGADLLALSNWLVLLSNAERNIWSLVSIKRPGIHAKLRNLKEGLWLQELKPRLESYKLRTQGPLQFQYRGQNSDLDLLILDPAAKFGLGCQLKWLTNPDRIRDVQYTEDELQNGLTQAELSLEWLNSLPNKLQTVTGLSKDELKQYKFRAAVISKNTIGSGWAYKPEIPIINRRLLHWILGEPHRRHLQTLWQMGEERRYLPKRGRHFNDEDIKVKFGGISFLGEEMGAKLLNPWTPAIDIDLTGLT